MAIHSQESIFASPPLAFMQEDNVLEIEPATAEASEALPPAEFSVAS